MPATPFNPEAAIIAHPLVPFNPATLQVMQPEEGLLVHKCKRRATRQRETDTNSQGRRIFDARYDPTLTYSVEATALSLVGLSNYHPGRSLSDRSLAFLNGEAAPFQFQAEVEGTRIGRLIYLDAEQEPGAGDTLETSFTIEHAFIDLDITAFPTGSADSVDPGLITLSYADWVASHPLAAAAVTGTVSGDPGEISTSVEVGSSLFAFGGPWLGRRVAAWPMDVSFVLTGAPIAWDSPCDAASNFSMTLESGNYLFALY